MSDDTQQGGAGRNLGSLDRVSECRAAAKRHAAYVRRLRRDLNEADWLAQLAEKYRLHFAADFSEIFGFLFPGVERTGQWKGSRQRRDADSFLREQVGLAFAFSNLNKEGLVLLPPYEVELRDRLELVERKLIEMRGDFFLSEEAIAELLGELRSDETLRQAIDGYRAGESLAEKSRAEVLSAIRRRFKGLHAMFLMLSAGVDVGLRSVAQLRDKGRLVPLSTYARKHWRGVTINHAQIAADRGAWVKALQKKRKEDRYYASVLDGVAASYLQAINGALLERGELLLLVTRGDMLAALRKARLPVHLDGVTHSNSPALSTSTLFTYLLYQGEGDNPSITRQNLQRARDLTDQFELVKDELISFPNRATDAHRVAALCERASAVLADVQAKSDMADTLRVLAARDRFLEPYTERAQHLASSSPDLALARRWLGLILEDAGLIEEIKAELDRLVRETLSCYSELDTFLGFREEVLSLEELVKIEVGELAPQALPHRFELAGLRSEGMPYKAKFRDREVEGIARRFAEAGSGPPEVLQGCFEALLELVGRQSEHAEVHLLIAYVQALSNQFQVALKETQKALALPDCPRGEAHFMEAVFLRLLDRKVLALDACHRSVEEDPEDARFLKEMGYIIWQCHESHTDCGYTLDDAIDFTTHAKRRCDDPELLQFVLNNLAYYHYERDAQGDLTTARGLLHELETILPKRNWNGYFLHTNAVVLNRYQQRDQNLSLARRQAIETQALVDVRRAVTLLAGKTPYTHVLERDEAEIRARQDALRQGAES